MARRDRRVLLLVLAAAPILSLAVVLVFAPGLRSRQVQLTLPPPPSAGFIVPRPVPLAADPGSSRWATVEHAVLAREAPALGARPVASVSTRTPEGTTNLLELLGSARSAPTGLWQRVLLATLPNGTTGWVPRSALGGSMFVDTRLIVDRTHFTATLLRANRQLMEVPIGVGQPQWPTPPGTFYVRDVLTRYAGAEYGPVAFGTSARSPTLTDWPAGGYVGIHGTDRPDLIPGAISHGCIRMRNVDILRLSRLMPVGTLVIIQ